MTSERVRRAAQAGFSLIELMIALVITMIVTGSIYGLMASGGNAFKRDPEITDRQQNLRIALDLLTRDTDIAGMRMGVSTQAFTDGLDGAGPANEKGGNSDILEIKGSDGLCPDIYVSTTNGANIVTAGEIPDCYPEPGLVLIIYTDGETKWANGWNIHAQNHFLNFPGGQQPSGSQIPGGCPNVNSALQDSALDCSSPSPAPLPQYIAQFQWIRYEIGNDTDGIPSLYRSDSAGYDLSTAAYTDPPGTGWELVARGIEDMQVEYYRESDSTANNQSFDWYDTPGTVTSSNLDTLVRKVRITISARTVSTNIQGATSAAAGPNAIRGEMTTVVAPPAAYFHLSTQGDMPWR